MDPTSLRYKKKLTRIFKQKLRKINDKQKDSKDPEAQYNDKDIEINDIELQRFIQEKIKQTTESIQKDNAKETKESVVLKEYPYPYGNKDTKLSQLLFKCAQQSTLLLSSSLSRHHQSARFPKGIF